MKKKKYFLLSIVLSACLVLLLVMFIVTESNTLDEHKFMYSFLYNEEESYENKFPTDFSKYYVDVSCKDNNDTKVESSWDFKKNNVNITYDEILNAKTPIICTLNLVDAPSLIGHLNLQLIQISHTIDSSTYYSYRYTGKNPDNYIWFNNEMWRIIGVVPACTAASGTTCSGYTPLVKIIRNDSIGTISFDADPTASSRTKDWKDSTLKTLLNNYYFISKNGTDTDYCYGHENKNKINCNYQNIGLGETDSYYGSMVQKVHWNVGEIKYDCGVSCNTKANDLFSINYELKTVTSDLYYVGLINISDYGFASTKYNDIALDAFSGEAATNNWLYGKGELWTINPTNKDDHVAYISGNGKGDQNYSSSGYQVHPVVYLKDNINIVSGDGTYRNPYQIALVNNTASS